MGAGLSVSDIVSVSVNLSPQAAQAQNTNTLLVLGSSAVIDTVQRQRIYTALSAVAADFGTSAPEYLAAAAYFGQTPQPAQIMIGRWAQTATNGELVGGPISAANQLPAVWNAITNGGVDLSVNSTPCNLTGLNFSAVTGMNGVASVLQTALAAIVAGTTVTWQPSIGALVVKSPTTGAASTVSFATAGAGTDISALLSWTSGTSGAYTVAGIVAETAVSAATLFDASFGQQWYALFICGAVDSDHLAVAAYINGAATKHLYAVNTQEGAVITAATSDIAYQLAQLGYNRCVVQYSSSSLYAVCSLIGRAITVNYGGNNTVITLMFKQEPGVVAETLTETQWAYMKGKFCNAFVSYNNGTAIVQYGVVSSGQYIDTITGTDNWAIQVQLAVYNLLYGTNKIPQTDAGSHVIQTAIEGVCAQFVADGLLAPGVWTTGGFGQLAQGQFMPKGYYVYAPQVATQSTAARAARQSVPFQVAGKLAGAVQNVSISISVNQ